MAQGTDFGGLSRAKQEDQHIADVKKQRPNGSLPLIPMRNDKGRYLAPHEYCLATSCYLPADYWPPTSCEDPLCGFEESSNYCSPIAIYCTSVYKSTAPAARIVYLSILFSGTSSGKGPYSLPFPNNIIRIFM